MNHVLLAVTGSIAAYKTQELLRSYLKQGLQVKVIFTQGALEFVRPEAYLALGAQEVFRPQDDFSNWSHFSHLELGRWADTLVVAPLSANTLASLAQGQANDLLTTLFLAWPAPKPISLYPAMNPSMWQHPLVQKNAAILKALPGVRLWEPARGIAACGDEGVGRLWDEKMLLATSLTPLPHKKKRVLITAGATRAPLDPVRFLSNPASGRTGLECARAFLEQGYPVTVVAGSACAELFRPWEQLEQFKLISVHTTSQMGQAVGEEWPESHLLIATAAPVDFEFTPRLKKIKKEDSLEWSSRLAPDILAQAIEVKKKSQCIIGFAAEACPDDEEFMQELRRKWQRKPVDLLVGNRVHQGTAQDPPQGFQGDQNTYYYFSSRHQEEEAQRSKRELALDLVDFFETYQQGRDTQHAPQAMPNPERAANWLKFTE